MALFQTGRLQEAQKINDKLLIRRVNWNDLHLAINVAISSGHWEQIVAIIDHEWPRRYLHDSKTLLRLAYLSAQRGQEASRPLELAKLATTKAPDDPHVLAFAYWLHFKLGRDDNAEPKWLMRAFELSSADEGPVLRLDLKDVFDEFFPKHWDQVQKVERKWLDGEIPLCVAANVFNVPFARILLEIPSRNTAELDGRRRGTLPIISGGRSPVELHKNWTIGLDSTSVMVLAYLDLLIQTIYAFHHVKLAPDIMGFLFRERDEACFHQPSLIEAAKQLRDLERAGQIQSFNVVTHPSKTLSDEVGFELAALFHMAEQDEGVVVCVVPIRKPASLMEELADTSTHDHLILSTIDICTLLHEDGKIDAEDYRRAILCLQGHDCRVRSDLKLSALNGPVFVDGLALTYLQDTKLLRPMVAAGLNIQLHPETLKHAHACIQEGDAGDELGAKIESIRTLLRDAVDDGSASFLPRIVGQEVPSQNPDFRYQATASLLAGTDTCDAICIDDRCLNSYENIVNNAGKIVPIVCILDILRCLHSQDIIDVGDHWMKRHKLRRSGFAFVLFETDELLYWLEKTRVSDGQVIESVELKTLRQTISRYDSLGPTSLKEITILSQTLMLPARPRSNVYGTIFPR